MRKIKVNFKMPPESLAQKLYRRQQELRKKSGLPDPEEYQKRIAQYNKELGMEKIKEAGPFSYGAKPPRRNSLADRIAKKRQELQRKQTPTEPRDQMVGTAKVMRNEDNNHIVEVNHRIGLTVTDPNHPMVSKRKETIQKTVRVSGEDRENAIKRAIAHYRRKGYKVHDHHYIGTVNEEVDLIEKYTENDIANGGTVIYKHDGKHYMSKVSHKTGAGAATKIHTTSALGHVVPLHHIVSTDASDWNIYKNRPVKEEVDIDEAAWGKDKMANLQAAHDRHSEKAIAANRAGDDEAVKVHQSKMNMIKNQMNKLRKEDVEQTNEGAQQLLRKYMPGYAKRQIDKKMDDQKFGRDDVAKDANFYRYKKVQDKLKKEEVEQVDELRTSTLLRYATKANKSLIGGDRNKEEKRIKGIQKANYKIQTRHRVKEDAELAEAEFEVGHSHHKTTRMTYSRLEAKNAKDAIAKSQKPGHDLVHVYNMDKETFHHPETGRKKSNQYEQVEEAWTQGNRNPQRGVKVGDKVRSYDFPGMHDDHYIEGHVVADNPHTYHIRVNKVVRSGKEIPVPAHMQHVEAPKGKGMFSNAYAVHKMMAKQQSVTAAPEPATGAQKTFGGMRNRLREAAGYWGKKSASNIEKIKKALEKERKQAASNPGALTKKKPPSRVKKDVQFYDYMAKTKT